jgi:hypothetical protein
LRTGDGHFAFRTLTPGPSPFSPQSGEARGLLSGPSVPPKLQKASRYFLNGEGKDRGVIGSDRVTVPLRGILKQPLDLERARQKKFRLFEPGIIYRCVGKH